jgi:hypothetical protein
VKRRGVKAPSPTTIEDHIMPRKKLKPNNLGLLVDELGELKARIAELEVREKEIKALLCDSGEELVKGYDYQAAITESERITLDSSKVRSYLTPIQIMACQRITSVKTVRVSARSE